MRFSTPPRPRRLFGATVLRHVHPRFHRRLDSSETIQTALRAESDLANPSQKEGSSILTSALSKRKYVLAEKSAFDSEYNKNQKAVDNSSNAPSTSEIKWAPVQLANVDAGSSDEQDLKIEGLAQAGEQSFNERPGGGRGKSSSSKGGGGSSGNLVLGKGRRGSGSKYSAADNEDCVDHWRKHGASNWYLRQCCPGGQYCQSSAPSFDFATYVTSKLNSPCPSGSTLINDEAECFHAYNSMKATEGWTGGTKSGTWGHVMQCGVHIAYGHGLNNGNTMAHFKTDHVDGSTPSEDWLHICKATTPVLPTEPLGSCWVWTPSGCADQSYSAASFQRDSWGEQHRNSGNDKSQCLSVRKSEFDAWCGVSDAVMHFIPPATPASPAQAPPPPSPASPPWTQHPAGDQCNDAEGSGSAVIHWAHSSMDLATCKQTCADDSACAAIVHRSSTHHCGTYNSQATILTNPDGVRKEAGWICYTKAQAPPPPPPHPASEAWKQHPAGDQCNSAEGTGSAVIHWAHSSMDLATCKQTCAVDSACAAIVHRSSTKHCGTYNNQATILTNPDGVRKEAGWICYTKASR